MNVLDLKNYLESRGLELEKALETKGVLPDQLHGKSAIRFDYLNIESQEIVNQKWRPLDEKRYTQRKGGKAWPWNLPALKASIEQSAPLIITEGEFDALACIMAGHTNVISVPAGAPAQASDDPFQAKRYDWIDDLWSHFSQVDEIIIAADNDVQGHNLLEDLSIRFGKAKCRYVIYPYGSDRQARLKDMNEVLLTYGQAGVTKTLENAKWIKVSGVYKMGELPPFEEGQLYPIGFNEIPFKIRKGDFHVVTGIPGHGKTTWVNDFVCRQVEQNGFRVAFASFEQAPQRDHKRNLGTWFLKKPWKLASDIEHREALAWMDESFSFIVPDDDDLCDIDWLFEKMATCVRRHGVDMIVIDPWNELDHHKGQRESLTEYVGKAIKDLKRFAKKYNVHLIVVAHPAKDLPRKRDKSGKFTEEYEMPSLYNISDSSHWFNKADIGTVIYKESENVTIVKIAKSKYHDIFGKPGEWFYEFSFHDNRFLHCPIREDEDGF